MNRESDVPTYSYSDLKYMNTDRLDEITSTFHCIKVPISIKEKIFLYFRKFPTESLLTREQEINGGRGSDAGKHQKSKRFELNMLNSGSTKKAEPSKSGLTAAKVITYKNRNSHPDSTPKEKFDSTTKKIMENFPTHRSLLVVNYDKQYDEDYLRSVFGVVGKIRRVFSHSYLKQLEAKRKKIFFNIVIFQDQISLIKCFDVEHLQWQLFEKFLPSFRMMTNLQKDQLFHDYVKSLQNNIPLGKLVN